MGENKRNSDGKAAKNVQLCLKGIKVIKFCPNIYLHVSLLLTVCTDIP